MQIARYGAYRDSASSSLATRSLLVFGSLEGQVQNSELVWNKRRASAKWHAWTSGKNYIKGKPQRLLPAAV